MTILTLTAAESEAVKAGARRTFEQLISKLAPSPGPLREAIRYELAWEMRRMAEPVIDRLSTEVPPQADVKTPPGYWQNLSEALRQTESLPCLGATAISGEEAERALRRIGAHAIPQDFDDIETLPSWPRGTPTEGISPITPLCEKCRRTILPGEQISIVDGGQVCPACRDAEWER